MALLGRREEQDVSLYFHLYVTLSVTAHRILLRPCEGVDSDKVAVIASGPDLDCDKVASSGEELAKAFYEISGRTDVQFGEVISLSVFR